MTSRISISSYSSEVEATSMARNLKSEHLQKVLPLGNIAIDVAETLFYHILMSYLNIWKSERSVNYIACCKLLYFFPDKFRSLKTYITVIILSLFVYLHSFSMSKQFLKFIKSYNLPEEMIKQFKEYYNHLEHESSFSEDTYHLKDVIEFCKTSNALCNHLNEFKTYITYHILSIHIAEGINLKINFFYNHPCEIPPQESCMDRIIRSLLTDKPPPYSYTYYPVEKVTSAFDDIIRMLKGNFTTIQRISGIASRSSKSPTKLRSSGSFNLASTRNSVARKSNKNMSSSRLRNLNNNNSCNKNSLNCSNINVLAAYHGKISKIYPTSIANAE